ncbi:MAG: sulfurtransferase TusA family protein [Desulfovibrio sp.]|jgi:TusA-related sulfurtransferase|nr:sulfurtransferase TusA family protein [Desulfovibrio sp.]
MSTTVIDVCGLACPEPLLAFSEAVKKGDVTEVEIRFDCAFARENLSRLAASLGWAVASLTEAREYTVMNLTKSA